MTTKAQIIKKIQDGYSGRDGLPDMDHMQLDYRKPGEMTFRFRYTSPLTGNKRNKTIGRFGDKRGELSLAQARQKAFAFNKDLTTGIDPMGQPKTVVVESIQQEDILLGEFINIMGAKKLEANITVGTKDNIMRAMTDFKREFSQVPVKDFTRRQAVDYIESKTVKYINEAGRERGGDRTAGLHKAALCSLWAHSLEYGHEYANVNPWLNFPKDLTRRLKAKRANKHIPAKELTRILNCLPSINPYATRALLVMLYSGGCRPNEATRNVNMPTGLDWSEIQWYEEEWQIPAWRMKARAAHNVPISKQFMRFLKVWHQEDGKPNAGPIVRVKASGKPLCRNGLALIVKSADLGFKPKDIRPTVRTFLQRVGCPFEVREKISAHTPSGVKVHYDLHSYKDEHREWLQIWADEMDKINGSSIVVQLLNNNQGLTVVK